MGKPFKFRRLGNIHERVAAAGSIAAAARELGVDRSTVFRWIKSGAVHPPGRRRPPITTPTPDQPPADWVTAVRERYELSETEQVMADLAAGALSIARDEAQPAVVRLQAMARFAALVKQLDFESEDASGEAETSTITTWPRRA
jgi:transposase-like protein